MLKHLKPFPGVAENPAPPFSPLHYEPIDGTQIPVVQDKGIDYCIVPRLVVRQLKASRDLWFWLSCGTGCITLAALTSVIVNQPKPTFVEKPVIVEKQTVVPTQCIIFCK